MEPITYPHGWNWRALGFRSTRPSWFGRVTTYARQFWSGVAQRPYTWREDD